MLTPGWSKVSEEPVAAAPSTGRFSPPQRYILVDALPGSYLAKGSPPLPTEEITGSSVPYGELLT